MPEMRPIWKTHIKKAARDCYFDFLDLDGGLFIRFPGTEQGLTQASQAQCDVEYRTDLRGKLQHEQVCQNKARVAVRS